MKKLSVIISVIVLVMVAFFVTSVSVFGQEKSVKLRYSHYWPPANPTSKLSEEWCREVEKRTSGRVTFSFFPGSTLTPPTQTYDSVVKGIADVGGSNCAFSPGRLPLTEVLQQPLGYKSASQATKLANAYYKKFKPTEFDDVKVMYLHGPDHGTFTAKKAISSIEDMKGLRILCNPQTAPIVSALGGAPVTLAVTEYYDSLQKGLAEGWVAGIAAMKDFRLGEVSTYNLENRAISFNPVMFVVMNKDRWNSLSREDQQTIEKINEEWAERQGKVWDQQNQEAIEYAIQKGVKFVKSPEEEVAKTATKMEPVIAEFVKKVKARGLPADEALKFCIDYIKKHP